MKNKRLWIGIGCGILVVALIVCIILMAGDNGKQPDPTSPATEPTGTTAGGNVTNPSDATDLQNPILPPEDEILEPTVSGPTVPSEGDTDSTNPDDYTEPTDPNPTPSDPVEPGEPDDPKQPEGPEQPDKPDDDLGDTPSVPDDDSGIPVEPSKPVDKTHDFGGITPSTITLDIWLSWDGAKSQAFVDTYGDKKDTWDLDTRWRYHCVISLLSDPYYKDGFYCSSEEDYKDLVARFNEPCDYCGKSCCKDTLYRTKNGMSAIDPRRCSEYDIQKDPAEYCQECGLKFGTDGCYQSVTGRPCDICGAERKPLECHTCHKDDEE